MVSILIVDDSNMLRDMLRFALVEGGYPNISEAVDGVEGVNLAKQMHFDLIITDINMPNLDGFGLLKELRSISSYESTPILVLTTERTDEMKQKGKDAGATGWIIKPFIPNQLLRAVNIILNK